MITFTETYDAIIGRISVNQTFANILAGVGNYEDQAPAPPQVRLSCSSTSNQFSGCLFVALAFDTSAIGGETVTSATLRVYCFGPFLNAFNVSDTALHVSGFSSTPSLPFVQGDYQKTNTTDYGSVAFPGGSAYASITLNAAGIAAINASGNTYLVLKWGCMQTGTFDGNWIGSTADTMTVSGLALGDPSQYAKLDVTHSGEAAPFNQLLFGSVR